MRSVFSPKRRFIRPHPSIDPGRVPPRRGFWGVNAKGYLNLALLVAVMCGAYALMAHNYGWELHTNMVKQALWYLS